MNWDDIKEAIKLFGFPGAMFGIFCFLLYKGYFFTRDYVLREREIYEQRLKEKDIEIQKLRESYDLRLKEKDAQHKLDKEEWAAQYDYMRTEKDEWRDTAMSNLKIAHRAVKAVENPTVAAKEQ